MNNMTFDRLYSLLFEAKYARKYAPRPHQPVNQPNDDDYSLSGIKNKILAYSKQYGIISKNFDELLNDLQTNDSSLLFRGHKTFNPFDVSENTKSPPGTVFWAKDPHNAAYLARPAAKGIEERSFYSLLQKAFDLTRLRGGQEVDEGGGFYNVSYMTIARPKNKNVKWYDNFGVERGYEEDNPEYYRQKLGRQVPGFNVSRPFMQGETALGKKDIERYTTYIFLQSQYAGSTNYFILLSLKKLAKIDNKLYNMLAQNKAWKMNTHEEIKQEPQNIASAKQKYNFDYKKITTDYYKRIAHTKYELSKIQQQIDFLNDRAKYQDPQYGKDYNSRIKELSEEWRRLSITLKEDQRRLNNIIEKLRKNLQSDTIRATADNAMTDELIDDVSRRFQ